MNVKRLVPALIVVVSWYGIAAAQAPEAPPRFRAAVELQPTDVTVIDGAGRPVRDLMPGEFKVFVDGAPRHVANAEWVSLSGEGTSAAARQGRRCADS